MNVELGILRWLRLDNEIYMWYIEASGGNICSHQEFQSTFFELIDGLFPRTLSDITMHHTSTSYDAICKVENTTCIFLRPCEYYRFTLSAVVQY